MHEICVEEADRMMKEDSGQSKQSSISLSLTLDTVNIFVAAIFLTLQPLCTVWVVNN